MAVSLTGTKTVTLPVAPHLTAAALSALLAIAPEVMTVGQLRQLEDAVNRISGGGNPSAVIGTLLA